MVIKNSGGGPAWSVRPRVEISSDVLETVIHFDEWIFINLADSAFEKLKLVATQK